MRAALANPELGVKQICPTCSAKFYDLNRRPALCPKCGESFDPEEAVRNRRVRSRVTPTDYEDTEEKDEEVAAKAKTADPDADGFEDEVDDTPEIDDEAAAEPIETDDDDTDTDKVATPGEDIGVDFAEDEDIEDVEGDDVPFLEDEDEDDFDEDDIDGLPGEGDDDN